MNLATRCTECSTVFRVVEDQLKVSEGWVRCGRCQAVFNARLTLLDLDAANAVPSTSAPAAPTAPSPSSARTAAPAPSAQAPDEPDHSIANAALDQAPAAAPTSLGPPEQMPAPTPALTEMQSVAETPAAPRHPSAARQAADGPAAATTTQDTDPTATDSAGAEASALPLSRPPTAAAEPAPPGADDWTPLLPPATPPASSAGLTPAHAEGAEAQALPDLALPTSAASDALAPDVVVSLGQDAAAGAAPAAVTIDADEALVAASFMRGDEASPWRRPPVRRALWLLALLLVLALLLQVLLAWRDVLAVRAPEMRPALQGLCHVLGCQMHAPRRIDKLAVESSSFALLANPGGTAALHRLAITLRNRADTAVRAPALDLGLTDPQGRVVTRRVVTLADLGLVQVDIPAGAELPLQAVLDAGQRRVSGYTVDLFYP